MSVDKLKSENTDMHTKLDLISRILSSGEIYNESFDKLKKLLDDDFMAFANDENSLAEEAQAILRLQAIKNQIDIILKFTGIYDKNIFAVGGGFSSGKSEFISSFFEDRKIRLPIGIKPVTVIPTYITSERGNVINGFSKNGGSIDISPDLYRKLSHDFVKSFSFNLKDIMPVMAIKTPLAYDNICFIDTPGYDPSAINDGFTKEDVNTAKEFLEQANVLLWLVGLDSNGTIPESDLKFLDTLDMENKKLYIVANKADLKHEADIEDILDNFEELLEDYDMDWAGISAYSSIDKAEINFKKVSLKNFLSEQDTPVDIYNQLLNELKEVFNLYKIAIKKDIVDVKRILKELKSLEFDILETSFDRYDSKVSRRITNLKKQFVIKEYEDQLNKLAEIEAKALGFFRDTFALSEGHGRDLGGGGRSRQIRSQ